MEESKTMAGAGVHPSHDTLDVDRLTVRWFPQHVARAEGQRAPVYGQLMRDMVFCLEQPRPPAAEADASPTRDELQIERFSGEHPTADHVFLEGMRRVYGSAESAQECFDTAYAMLKSVDMEAYARDLSFLRLYILACTLMRKVAALLDRSRDGSDAGDAASVTSSASGDAETSTSTSDLWLLLHGEVVAWAQEGGPGLTTTSPFESMVADAAAKAACTLAFETHRVADMRRVATLIERGEAVFGRRRVLLAKQARIRMLLGAKHGKEGLACANEAFAWLTNCRNECIKLYGAPYTTAMVLKAFAYRATARIMAEPKDNFAKCVTDLHHFLSYTHMVAWSEDDEPAWLEAVHDIVDVAILALRLLEGITSTSDKLFQIALQAAEFSLRCHSGTGLPDLEPDHIPVRAVLLRVYRLRSMVVVDRLGHVEEAAIVLADCRRILHGVRSRPLGSEVFDVLVKAEVALRRDGLDAGMRCLRLGDEFWALYDAHASLAESHILQ